MTLIERFGLSKLYLKSTLVPSNTQRPDKSYVILEEKDIFLKHHGFFTIILFAQTKFIRTTILISIFLQFKVNFLSLQINFPHLHYTGFFSASFQCLCFVKMFLQLKSSVQSTFFWGPCSLLVTLLKGKLIKMCSKAASVPCFSLFTL